MIDNSKKTILISPDSFKKCSTSVKIAQYFNEFIPQSFNKIIKPVSDGGDGFLDVCKFYFGGEIIEYKISTPYHGGKVKSEILYCPDKKRIYIESTNVLGIKIIPPEKRKPILLSSKGLGELLLQISKDVEKNRFDISDVVIGVGGTGTIDMGIGACSQLGLKLMNSEQEVINPIPANFQLAKTIQIKLKNLPFKLSCIVDVNTPLLGNQGAIRIFGHQKGASIDDCKYIEDGLSNLLNLLNIKEITNPYNVLNGAGGGVATGLKTFFGAKIYSGIEFINENMEGIFESKIDYVITGEGAYDIQSLAGKGASSIVEKFKNKAKKIFLVCGFIEPSLIPELPENVIVIELLRYFDSVSESIQNIEEGIRLASIEIFKHIEK